MHQAHPFPSTTSRSFHHERPAYTFGFALQGILRLIGTAIAWKNRYANMCYKISRSMLIAHGRDSCWRWANKDQASICTGPGEITVFCQETETGVNSICSRAPCSTDDRINHEIGLAGW